MKIKIYDRKNNKYIYEKTNTFLIFLYNTYIGRCILKILSRPFFSKICSIYMNSKFSRPIIKKYIKKYNIKEKGITYIII